MANYWSKNPIQRSIDADGAAAVKLDLWVESAHGTGDFELIFSQKLVPGTSGFCLFRIETILDSLLEEARQEESLNLEAQFTRSTATIRNFYTVATRLDEEGESLGTETSDPDSVLLGSISHLAFPASPSFSGPMALHSRPAGITIRRGLIFLSVLYEITEATSIRFRFEDTDDDTERIVDVAYSGDEFEGIAHILLNQWPADNEKPRFEVGLTAGEGFSFGPFALTLDRDYAPMERQFLFRNSLGGWETMTATGIATEKLEVDRQVASRILGAEYLADRGGRFVYQQEARVSMKVHSGWMANQAQARWLSWQLLCSTEVFEILSGKRVPVVLNTRSIDTYQDENFLAAFAFEYQYSFPSLASPL